MALVVARTHAHQVPAAVQFLAVEIEDQVAFGVALVRIAFGKPVPRSQIMTVPPPYSPSGMVPSKALYSIGWSSTWTARRFSPGSRLGPRVTAQLFITPSSSSRKS